MVSRIGSAPDMGHFVTFVTKCTRYLPQPKVALAFFLAMFLAVGYTAGIIFPPRPTAKTIIIERGMTAEDIARALKNANIIRSERLFVWAVYFSGLHDRLGAGTFEFSEPESLVLVIRRLVAEQKEVTLLVREGETLREIAESMNQIGLDGAGFMREAGARALEGYLFPDTYRFFESVEASDVIDALTANFDKKVAPLAEDIGKSGRSRKDIVVMASIIEREVRDSAERKMVSGILWKRLDLGMPLQVDASPETYEHAGFPQAGAISNPGLDAIEAAIRPTASPYLYYLTGRDGTTHFARTFDEHKLNKARYLR